MGRRAPGWGAGRGPAARLAGYVTAGLGLGPVVWSPAYRLQAGGRRILQPMEV